MSDNRKYKAKQGEIKYMVVTIKDANGRLVDLDGYEIDFVVTPADGQTLLFGGSMAPNPDQVTYKGQASYMLQETDTIDKDPERYDLELKVVSPTGERMLYPLVEGGRFGTFEILESKIGLY